MNYRQVHIDFHTSEYIDGIGSKFDKKQFQEALKAGHVDSITVFSKCHHGWSYHPTKVNQMHPNLSYDLLKAQIDAAHEIGVKAVVYISAGYDEKYALEHKDCAVRNADGTTNFIKTFDEPGFHWLCMNTPYLDFLLSQIREVLENYDLDGLFLDIIRIWPCYCDHCKKQLIEEGKNPSDVNDVTELAERVYAHYAQSVRKLVDEIKPGISLFHNCGHVIQGRRDMIFDNTHLELESLPTGGWGYDHFPTSAAYARTLGMDYLGMTGKFHTSWGEFGGFKHPNALRYETALSIANGAACSIGDQLHPNGKMDMATYKLIGAAYKEVEEKEPWIKGAENIADIAFLSTEAHYVYYHHDGYPKAENEGLSDVGCSRILLEGKYLFNCIDTEEDFGKYKLIILPDLEVCDKKLADKLKEYVGNGGQVLASGKSCMDSNNNCVLDLGLEGISECEYSPCYYRPNFKLKSLDASAYVIYNENYTPVKVSGRVWAECEYPYFNRTKEHFCSHMHAPNNPEKSCPAIIQGKDGIYIGCKIFEEYAAVGSITVKEMVCRMIDELLSDKSAETNLPAQGVITLTKQGEREIVHLLYASPVKRGKNVEVIEDILPVYNTKVRIKFAKEAKRVYLAPQNRDISFEQNGEFVEFNVDEFECHQMVVIE